MAGRSNNSKGGKPSAPRPVFPFTAVVGQEEMKLALLLNVVAPAVGGVLVTGHRGTGKSTAVRALADLLPQLETVCGCAYNCDPADADALCGDCAARLASGESLGRGRKGVPVVELPLGATEDRVCGTIDLGRALQEGVKAFEPGLLARANRGFLYIDEVNLLEDHLVDLLLDVAATGRNRVEREGVSAEHPARFVLVGSGNPEEGELRPQLLDRFGLVVEITGINDVGGRVAVIERRMSYDATPEQFTADWQDEEQKLADRILAARALLPAVQIARSDMAAVAALVLELGVDGHRADLAILETARTHAAWSGRTSLTIDDIRLAAELALPHRMRRQPFTEVKLDEGRMNAILDRANSEEATDNASSAEGVKKNHP